MPEIHNSVQMQESVETSFAFLARTLPEAMQSLAKPQVIACDYEARTLELAFEIKHWMFFGLRIQCLISKASSTIRAS